MVDIQSSATVSASSVDPDSATVRVNDWRRERVSAKGRWIRSAGRVFSCYASVKYIRPIKFGVVRYINTPIPVVELRALQLVEQWTYRAALEVKDFSRMSVNRPLSHPVR